MMASGCNEICRSPPPLPRFSTVVWGMLAPVEDVSISIILSGSPRGHTLLFVQEQILQSGTGLYTDLLFIPHHWWHHVETTSGDPSIDHLSISLNLWRSFTA